MRHTSQETKSHLKVLLFFILIGAEVGLTWISGDILILNTIAVVTTAYATYQLDNIFDWLCECFKKGDNDGLRNEATDVSPDADTEATGLLDTPKRNWWW